MLKKTILLALTILLCFNFQMYCQNCGNNWVFGDSVGLSFNSGAPAVLTQPVLSSHESSSSISDSSGNLQFYVGSPTNYATQQFYIYKIWNSNNQTMINGDSLFGCTSYTQGVIVLPNQSNQNYFYIFHIGYVNGLGRYLFYSTVDLSANNGSGAIILKNSPLQILSNNKLTEKMIAVRHANGRDWWLIVHDFGTTFCSFLISPTGISSPLFQSIGSDLSFGRSAGQMQISPDGTKLAIAGENALDLYDYNRCTGAISNWVYLGDTLFPATEYGYYGTSFSPNSQLLYVSNLDTLFQYDLNAPDIRNSRVTIFTDTCHLTCHIGQHLLGPDNKIYIANTSGYGFGNTIYDAFNMSISYIENPNSLGFACNFSYLGQYLGGKRSFFGLPNIPIFSMGPMVGSVCDSLTSTHEINSINQTTVFNNGVEIIINSTYKDQLKIKLYNTNGQLVLEKGFRQSTGLTIPTISGIYFYNITTEYGKSTVRGKLCIVPK